MLDADELALLERVALNTATGPERGQPLRVTVNGCAYSCCGKGWQRRVGHEQVYTGWIDSLNVSSPSSFMVFGIGIGTVSYVVAVLDYEVELVEVAPGLAPVVR